MQKWHKIDILSNGKIQTKCLETKLRSIKFPATSYFQLPAATSSRCTRCLSPKVRAWPTFSSSQPSRSPTYSPDWSTPCSAQLLFSCRSGQNLFSGVAASLPLPSIWCSLWERGCEYCVERSLVVLVYIKIIVGASIEVT